MHLALNMAKMVKETLSRAAFDETQQLINNPHANVGEEKMRGVRFPVHNKAKAAIERHLAMVRENQTVGSLPCHNGSAKNPQICWRRKETGAHQTQPAPLRPGM